MSAFTLNRPPIYRQLLKPSGRYQHHRLYDQQLCQEEDHQQSRQKTIRPGSDCFLIFIAIAKSVLSFDNIHMMFEIQHQTYDNATAIIISVRNSS